MCKKIQLTLTLDPELLTALMDKLHMETVTWDPRGNIMSATITEANLSDAEPEPIPDQPGGEPVHAPRERDLPPPLRKTVDEILDAPAEPKKPVAKKTSPAKPGEKKNHFVYHDRTCFCGDKFTPKSPNQHVCTKCRKIFQRNIPLVRSLVESGKMTYTEALSKYAGTTTKASPSEDGRPQA